MVRHREWDLLRVRDDQVVPTVNRLIKAGWKVAEPVEIEGSESLDYLFERVNRDDLVPFLKAKSAEGWRQIESCQEDHAVDQFTVKAMRVAHTMFEIRAIRKVHSLVLIKEVASEKLTGKAVPGLLPGDVPDFVPDTEDFGGGDQ